MRTRRSPRNQEILWRELERQLNTEDPGPGVRQSEVEQLESILQRKDISTRHRKAFERDLQRAKIKQLKKEIKQRRT